MFKINYYPDDIASVLYKLSSDIDIQDYSENKEHEIRDLQECLYQLLAIAQNKYNSEFYRTFWNCLERITSIYE
jgi:hypothetical protein